jgi:hypothetical protein
VFCFDLFDVVLNDVLYFVVISLHGPGYVGGLILLILYSLCDCYYIDFQKEIENGNLLLAFVKQKELPNFDLVSLFVSCKIKNR